MGLFDKMKSGGEQEFSARSAMLLACATMVAVDGNIDDDEINILQKLDANDESKVDWNAAMELFEQLNTKSVSLEQVVTLVSQSLNEEQKAFTMVNLINICMTDGNLDDSEETLLDVYVDAFELDEDFIKKAVDIMVIKNKKTIF